MQMLDCLVGIEMGIHLN